MQAKARAKFDAKTKDNPNKVPERIHSFGWKISIYLCRIHPCTMSFNCSAFVKKKHTMKVKAGCVMVVLLPAEPAS